MGRLAAVSAKSRFNTVLVLGLLFLALVVHNLFNTWLRIILERESHGNVLRLLPGNPILVVSAALPSVLVFSGIVVWINRRLGSRSTSRARAGDRFFTIFFGTGFILAATLLLWKYPRYPLPQEWSGAAAAVVGISLLLFTFLVTRRSLVIAHVCLVIAVLAAGTLPRLLPGHHQKVVELRKLMDAAAADLDQRQQTWRLVDPLETLTEARARAEENLVYRFDENLQDVAELEAPKIDTDDGVIYDFLRDGKLVAAGAAGPESELVDGKQVFPDYRGGSFLRTEKPLDLPWSAIGSFQITMKVSGGDYFQVFWGKKEVDQRHSIRIPLGLPGQSTSYELREKIIRYRGADLLKHIWIVPSNEDARVEIESFRILDRTYSVLKGAPFNVGYENVKDEIRRVLFASTPSRITYKAKVPPSNPRLLFGISTPDETIPTTFEVSVGHGGREQTVFSRTISGEGTWDDVELSLGAWAGKTVDISFVTSAPEQNLGHWSNPVLLGEPAPTPNVVIYLVDCLRADHLGVNGYFRDTSPVFDSLCTRGTLFTRAFSNGCTTKLSIPSLFTSHPVTSTGVRAAADVLPTEFPTMAEIIRTMGYATAAFATNGNVGPYSGTHKGFSRLIGRSRFVRGAAGNAADDAEHMIGSLMEAWIQQNRNRNFFLYIHTMDAHGPYDPPEPYRRYFESVDSGTPVERQKPYDPRWVKEPTREGRTALYDGEIAYGDVHLGRFVSMLEEAGVLDNTIFIFTADHGEYLGEHRKWGHNPPAFVQGTNIPLFMMGPGIPSGVRVEENVQILDILPTVLDALGLDPDPVFFQGESLTPLFGGDPPAKFSGRTVFIEGGHPKKIAFLCGQYHVLPEKTSFSTFRKTRKKTLISTSSS